MSGFIPLFLMMDPGECIVALAGMIFMFGTPTAIYAINVFGRRQQEGKSSETEGLRQSVLAQGETLRQVQERLSNLEHVVAGNEYQAAQRVAKALEDRTPPEIGRSAAAESGGGERVTAR